MSEKNQKPNEAFIINEQTRIYQESIYGIREPLSRSFSPIIPDVPTGTLPTPFTPTEE